MERTYVFNSDGNAGGSKMDITALLPGMLGGGRSVDPNLLALMGNRNGFGGQDGWWSIIWLVVIASIFGWNGNGGFFGGRGGNGCNGLPAELAGNAGRELLMQAIQGNGNAISQLASSFNCSTQQIQAALCNVQNSITQVGNQVGLSTNQIINAMQSGNQAILTQLADCCCKTQNAITTMGLRTSWQCATRPILWLIQPTRILWLSATVRLPTRMLSLRNWMLFRTKPCRTRLLL